MTPLKFFSLACFVINCAVLLAATGDPLGLPRWYWILGAVIGAIAWTGEAILYITNRKGSVKPQNNKE